MEDYETLGDAVGCLIERGYSTDFTIIDKIAGFERNLNCTRLNARDFTIDEVYIFDDIFEAGHEVVIMAISSKKYTVKGILINALSSDTDDSWVILRYIKNFLKCIFSNH